VVGWRGLQCGGCTGFTSQFTRLEILNNYDARFVIVTTGPIQEALAYKQKVGNRMEWYSSSQSPFAADMDGESALLRALASVSPSPAFAGPRLPGAGRPPGRVTFVRQLLTQLASDCVVRLRVWDCHRSAVPAVGRLGLQWLGFLLHRDPSRPQPLSRLLCIALPANVIPLSQDDFFKTSPITGCGGTRQAVRRWRRPSRTMRS
jgi:Bacterial protein of unknown function (DUF899)